MTLTADYLRTILDYDPETGIFTWKEREDAAPQWNSRLAGKRAGTLQPNGRGGNTIVIGINGRTYPAHRLAWLYMTERWPAKIIDHRDGNCINNAFANLREATNSQKKAKDKRRSNNVSGYKGVSRSPSGCLKPWTARIQVNGNVHYLGLFDTPEEAHNEYIKAAKKHFGEFANPG